MAQGVYPVSTGLVVEALAARWLVEIDATAVLSGPAGTSS